MITFFKYGAMYAKIEDGDQIDTSPVKLGDGILHPGEWIWKIGEKARTSFEMSPGYYLRFIGSGQEGRHRTLLFAVNRSGRGEYCYAFDYVDHNTLVVGSPGKCSDIKIQHLKKFTELPADAAGTTEQPSLWEVVPE